MLPVIGVRGKKVGPYRGLGLVVYRSNVHQSSFSFIQQDSTKKKTQRKPKVKAMAKAMANAKSKTQDPRPKTKAQEGPRRPKSKTKTKGKTKDQTRPAMPLAFIGWKLFGCQKATVKYKDREIRQKYF